MLEKIKQDWEIYTIAFCVPFINMIAYLIEFYLTCPFKTYVIDRDCYISFSEVIGGSFLLFYIPLLIFIVLLIPKKIIPIKNKILKTFLWMILFGWLLVILSYSLSDIILKIMVN